MTEKEEACYIAGQRSLARQIVLSKELSGLLPSEPDLARWHEVELQVFNIWNTVFPGEPFDHDLHLADVLEKIGDELDSVLEGR